MRARPDDDRYAIPWPFVNELSDESRAAARRIRGQRGPAIMLHGVMPRSGTVYVGELLRLHPDLHAYPNQLWEIPFLELASKIRDLQASFYRGYKMNSERMRECDFLPLFGSAFLDYLHGFAASDSQRLLVKEAGVSHLGAFPAVFPAENLLLLMRDGRDLVHSTLRTWPKLDFDETCRLWAQSTRAVLEYHELHKDRSPACWLVKFEDVQSDPSGFIHGACERFDLAADRYPFESMSEVRLIGSSTTSKDGRVDWSKHERAPENFRPVGHWQSWPRRWKRSFKRIAGQQLMAAGYAADCDW